VEQKIWKGLFEIAQGGDIEAGILQMISEVPNEFISLAARSWYNLAGEPSLPLQLPSHTKQDLQNMAWNQKERSQISSASFRWMCKGQISCRHLQLQ
jgi:hypothetical protein